MDQSAKQAGIRAGSGSGLWETEDSTGSIANPFGYAGEYTDSETGFLYLRARYYDPATQQFLTVDPALVATAQAYAYAADSPLNATDPSGKFLFVPLLIAAGVGALVNIIAVAVSPAHQGHLTGPEILNAGIAGAIAGVGTAAALVVGGGVVGAVLVSAVAAGAGQLIANDLVPDGQTGDPAEAALWGGIGGLATSAIKIPAITLSGGRVIPGITEFIDLVDYQRQWMKGYKGFLNDANLKLVGKSAVGSGLFGFFSNIHSSNTVCGTGIGP